MAKQIDLSKMTKAELLKLLASVSDDEKVPAEVATGTAKQFSSLGYVVVGDGDNPGEGAVLNVPTRAGKLAKVRTIRPIETAVFGLEAEWAFTYERLRRDDTQ